MKGAAFKNPGNDFSIEIIDKPMPTPKEGEILVRLNVTGLCHSDLHLMMADWDGFRTQMQTVGHEGAGVVEELGPGVKGWQVGDRAGVKPISSVCFSCDNCGRDLEAHCPNAVFSGINMEGTYQQYICVPAFYATHIPDGVDDFMAAPVMCSGATAYRSLMASNLKVGHWAVFPGAGGGVGHMVLQVARAMGIRCIAIDGGEEKRALCMELGAEEYLDFSSGINVEARVKEITGGGADAVFVTSSSASSYSQAPGLLRVGGIVMCLSMPPSGQVIAGADPNIMTSMALSIRGTMVGSLADCDRALDLAKRGLLRPRYTKFKLSELPHAVSLLRTGKVAGRAIVDLWA